MTTSLVLQTKPDPHGEITLRAPVADDAHAIGWLLHRGFTRIHTAHGFASDFPRAATAIAFARRQIDDPMVYGVVAELGGRIVGVNFLTEGDPIRGVGPIAVLPNLDNRGIGRMLMYDVIERGASSAGLRLLQDSFNMKTLALYTRLGFRVREPVVLLKGRLSDTSTGTRLVRPMNAADLRAVDELTRQVTGFPRSWEVRRALYDGTPWVVEAGRRITGYATAPHDWASGHAAAESDADFEALVQGICAGDARPLAFLLPVRSACLLRLFLGQGLSIVKPMNLMTRGRYQPPQGVYVPSVHY